MTSEQFAKLLLLSLVWGGSFLFAGMAVEYVHPLWVVTVRVGLAAIVMLLVLRSLKLALPNEPSMWLKYIGMGLLNNVIPFSAIFYAQTYISVSLASIVNSMTPVFTFVVLASFGVERLSANRVLGALVGIAGTALLFSQNLSFSDSLNMGLLLSLTAALSYAFSGFWAKLFLANQAPVTASTSQLLCSTVVMLILVSVWQIPLPEQTPPFSIIAALVGLAVISTAFAYVLFFDVLNKSGPSNASLVTLLIPISACLLGWIVMGDQLTQVQILGAIIISLGLVIIDGRWWHKVRSVISTPGPN